VPEAQNFNAKLPAKFNTSPVLNWRKKRLNQLGVQQKHQSYPRIFLVVLAALLHQK
jgi:hypothetical protein